MRLIDGWRAEINRLWSIKLALLSAFVELGNQIFSVLAGVSASQTVSILSAIFAIAAVIARVIKQGVKDDSGSA